MKLPPTIFRALICFAFLALHGVTKTSAQAAPDAIKSTLLTISGVPRACAGGLKDDLHTICLSVRLSPAGRSLAGKKVSFRWLINTYIQDFNFHPDHATLLGDNGNAVSGLDKTIAANEEIKIAIRSGRRVAKPILMVMHDGRAIGRIECDFGPTLDYRRFPDRQWPGEEGDSGWLERYGPKGRHNNKIYLKFQRDARRGDVPGNWAVVVGHRVSMRFTVNLRDGRRFDKFEDTKHYLHLLDAKGKPTFEVSATTGSDGAAFFQHGYGDKAGHDFSYSLEVENLTQIGEDEAVIAASTPLPMTPLVKSEWIKTLGANQPYRAGFGDVIALFPAPEVKGKLAVATTVSPGVMELSNGLSIDILQFPKGARKTHELNLSNLYADYPLQFSANGRSVFVAGGQVVKSDARNQKVQNVGEDVAHFDDHGHGPPLVERKDLALRQALYRYDFKQNSLRAMTPQGGSYPWFSVSPDGRRLAFLHSNRLAPRADEALPFLVAGDLETDVFEEQIQSTPAPILRFGQMPLPNGQLANSKSPGQAELLRAFIQSFSTNLPPQVMQTGWSWTAQNGLLLGANEAKLPAAPKNKTAPVFANTFEIDASGENKKILDNAWRATRSPDNRHTAFYTFENGVRFDPELFVAPREFPYGVALHVQKTGAKPLQLTRLSTLYPDLFWLPGGQLLSCENFRHTRGKILSAHFILNLWDTVMGTTKRLAQFRAPDINLNLTPVDFNEVGIRERDSFTPLRLSRDGKHLIIAYQMHSGDQNSYPLRNERGSSLSLFYAVDVKDGSIAPLAAVRGARGFDWSDAKAD